jgi:SWI/SNF-related matrix-associated actin-dependent regulator of chromatin subfamily A-like protein 1
LLRSRWQLVLKTENNPFPFQEEGADFLASEPWRFLADEMGLGKTVQAILAADQVGADRVLIVCPSIAKINWWREFQDWSIFSRDFCIPEKLSDRPTQGQSIICSFKYAAENKDLLRAWGFDVGVVDEAHFLKSVEADRARAILGVDGVIRGCKRFWALSGTPAPNNASELWIWLYTFGATKMSYSQFIDTFCLTRHTKYGTKVLGSKSENIPALKKLLKKIMLRRLKKDVMKDLPPLLYGSVYVEPGAVWPEKQKCFDKYYGPDPKKNELVAKLREQAEIVKAIANSFPHDGMNMVDALSMAGDSIAELRQFVGLQKVEPTVDLVDRELMTGAYKKIVIFAHHQSVLEGLKKGLKKYGAEILNGKTSKKKRQRIIDSFQKDPKKQVILCNIAVAGSAITLTAANHVLFVERDWVPGNNAQAIMRIHRYGQSLNCYVRFVSIHGTMDQRIANVLLRKTKDLTKIFDD